LWPQQPSHDTAAQHSAAPDCFQHEGVYFYSDYCAGWLRSFRLVDGQATDLRDWNVGDIGSVVSFGEDAAGEVYIVSFNGTVYRIVATD
jgi:hypothetical protein